MAETYSYSKLESFDQCALKYKYHYIQRLEGDRETIEAFMGSRVHETFEMLYKDVAVTKLNPVEELLAYYDAQWEKHWTDRVVVVKQEYTADHYRDLGRQCIREYYQRFYPFDDGKTLGLEDRFSIMVKHGDASYKFTGVIDRLVWKGEGIYEIHDYKTARTPPTQADFEQNKQLAIYHMSLKQRWPDVKTVKLIWHYVALNKDFTSSREESDLEQLSKDIVERIQKIEATTDFPAKQSALCGWCEYRSICPLWKHEVKVAALSPGKYQEDTGVQLVKKYVELQHKADAVKEEIAELEQAIFTLAEKEGVGQLDGPEHRLRIFIEEELGAPFKKDHPEQWEKLRQLMVSSGKYQDVSTINGRMLTYQLERGGWPSTLKTQVEALLQKHQKRQLKIYKKTF